MLAKVTRWRPTLPQVRFGGGRLEKEPQGHLVSRLPNEVCDEDKSENELSIREGFRILSAYRTAKDVRLWIITEADRSSTMILLPEEY